MNFIIINRTFFVFAKPCLDTRGQGWRILDSDCFDF